VTLVFSLALVPLMIRLPAMITRDENLLQHASAVALRAYAPYSKAQVGCALIAASGQLYTGCNVENASYGLTICAERNAIFAGVAAEGPTFRIARLAVIALGLEFPPCGACRQVMAEFTTSGAGVLFLRDGQTVVTTMGELLPAAFSLRG
jgi:cytidine deaminase